VLTHDTMVEGVHFLAGQDAADVAWKLVSVNMSDLAAKGAKPLGVLLGYMTADDDSRFLEGLAEALAHYGAALLGGDTVSASGAQVLGLTALGTASHTPVPSRSGARPGDGLFVTGELGAAMAGFEAIKAGTGDSLAYRRPMARLAEGIALAPHVSAMMDISDGLLLDTWRMASASGVTIAIDGAAVPLAVSADRRDEALRWGDDYELLFTAPPGAVLPVHASLIGTVMAPGKDPLLLDGRVPHGKLGYEHG
jgi:thiamine-monophosphate kinase